MNEEELYKLALSDIHKYNLLNEIFAIRDKRFSKEQQDSMLYVNGYIGIDTLNNYVNLINQLQQKENKIKEVREYCLEKAKGRLERTLYDDILEILDKENKQ